LRLSFCHSFREQDFLNKKQSADLYEIVEIGSSLDTRHVGQIMELFFSKMGLGNRFLLLDSTSVTKIYIEQLLFISE